MSVGLFIYGFTAIKTHLMVVRTHIGLIAMRTLTGRGGKPLIGVAIFSVGTTNIYERPP